ncbi:hypothetical protein BX600DRAFT_148081 [Xylariales sp. PMI_506]|nr:hypothetical protein BX600DRAFT_148081 [Xylariales sp. PMI_506]
MVYYYKCMRFLLYPVILSADLADVRFLKTCAEACGGVCQTYKKLHQAVPVGFSVMALYSIFLAGLTLLYCTWAAPKEVFSISTSNDINACSIVLYIITERWTGAKKYRDIFETVKQAVLESIEEGSYEPRRIIRNLRPGLETAFSTIEPTQEVQGEFSVLVADMAGGPSIEAVDITSAGSNSREGDFEGLNGGFNFSMQIDTIPFDFHDLDTFGNVDMNIGTLNNHDWMI